MYQNFEVMAGLNYRFIRNLHACVCVFNIYKTDKKVVKLFSLVHISFSNNLVYLAYAEFLFFKQILHSFEYS